MKLKFKECSRNTLFVVCLLNKMMRLNKVKICRIVLVKGGKQREHVEKSKWWLTLKGALLFLLQTFPAGLLLLAECSFTGNQAWHAVSRHLGEPTLQASALRLRVSGYKGRNVPSCNVRKRHVEIPARQVHDANKNKTTRTTWLRVATSHPYLSQ